MHGLQLLVCWDCRSESCWGHGCLSLVSVLCFHIKISEMGQYLTQRSPTECVCVIEFDQVQ
jgi:hypothetical protein